MGTIWGGTGATAFGSGAISDWPVIMLKGFISYAREDQAGCDKLLRQLKPLERNGSITFWADQAVDPGDVWHDSIIRALDEADIALFLASPDMCFSDFIFEIELPLAIERWKRGTLSIIPVLLRPCLWDVNAGPCLGQLQATPGNKKTISSYASEDEGYFVAAQHIKRIVESKLADSRKRPTTIKRAAQSTLSNTPEKGADGTDRKYPLH